MEKSKLKLNEIHVNSFVTKIDQDQKQTLDGGASITDLFASPAWFIRSVLLPRKIGGTDPIECPTAYPDPGYTFGQGQMGPCPPVYEI